MSDKLLTINYPSDLRLLDEAQLHLLITQFYHRRCFCKEGHLGASLGVIELTITALCI
jgi:deoxyxylulose-5-phosphate synthase